MYGSSEVADIPLKVTETPDRARLFTAGTGAWLSSAVVGVSESRKNPLRMLVLFLAAAGVGLVVSLLMPVRVPVNDTSVIDRSGG